MTCVLGTNIKQATLVINVSFYELCVNVPTWWEQYVQCSPSILTFVQIACMNIGRHFQDWVVLPYGVRCHDLVSFSALYLGIPSSESCPRLTTLFFFFQSLQRNVKIIHFKNMPITVYFYIPPNLSLAAIIHLIMYKPHGWETHKSVLKNLDYFSLDQNLYCSRWTFKPTGCYKKPDLWTGWKAKELPHMADKTFPRWFHPIVVV
jgi:hypothetical protein